MGECKGAAYSVCNLKYSVLKQIHIYGSNYDYHFIRKEMAQEFQGQFNCLRENPEKYIAFSLSEKRRFL